MGNFHETRNDVDMTWSTVYAQTHSHLSVSLPFGVFAPHSYRQALLWQNSKTFLAYDAWVKPCLLNDLRAPTLRHNVILSTNSMSRQSGTMSPVNCSRMRTPQKLHCQVETTRGQRTLERHQISCQDYSFLFLITTETFHGETGRRRHPTPEVSVMRQPCREQKPRMLERTN